MEAFINIMEQSMIAPAQDTDLPRTSGLAFNASTWFPISTFKTSKINMGCPHVTQKLSQKLS
jgi:hypothetical protein